MTYLRDLVTDNDLSFFFALFGIFYVGRLFARRRPRVYQWGVRLSAAAFVVVAVMRVAESRRPMGGDLLSALFFGAIAAGLVAGFSWIVMGCAAFVFDHVEGANQAARARHDQAHRERLERRRRAEDERRRRQQASEERRRAPMRKRQQQEQARRQRIDAQRRAEEQRRKRKLRVQCQLLYDRHSRQLATIMSRERADEYLREFLGEDRPLETIRDAAQLFRAMITDALSEVGEEQEAPESLREITDRFRQERAGIESLDTDDESKASLLAFLHQQERNAIGDLLARSRKP